MVLEIVSLVGDYINRMRLLLLLRTRLLCALARLFLFMMCGQVTVASLGFVMSFAVSASFLPQPRIA